MRVTEAPAALVTGPIIAVISRFYAISDRRGSTFDPVKVCALARYRLEACGTPHPLSESTVTSFLLSQLPLRGVE